MLYEYLIAALAHAGGAPALVVIIVPAPGAISTVIDQVAQYWIGTAGQDGQTGYWTIQSTGAGWTGSVTIKAREAGSLNTFAPVPYTAWALNGAVSDGLSHTAAMTSDSALLVPSSGQDVALDCTAASGSLTVDFRAVRRGAVRRLAS